MIQYSKPRLEWIHTNLAWIHATHGMYSWYHGMNSFHPKCTKHGKMLIIQLRKEVPKKFFYIIDCHHKCEFWEISLTLNSKKYVEWIHSMVPWIHSMVVWIQAQGGMNSFLVVWIHSTLGIPILIFIFFSSFKFIACDKITLKTLCSLSLSLLTTWFTSSVS